MTVNWQRECRLLVGMEKGQPEAVDFSNLRIRFEIRQQMTSTPGSATIYIYNPAAGTINDLIGEGQDVLLQAGYVGNFGTIFQGQVRQLIRGRESPTDTFLCVVAQNADTAHNYAVTNTTLAAGHTQQEIKEAHMRAYREKGIIPGQQDAPADYQFPRGRAIFCMSRDGMDNYAKTNGMQWGYDNNQLVCTQKDMPPDENRAVVVNVETGMIGMPQMTINGVMVTTLLNPRIKHGTSQIKLNNKDIQYPTYDVAYGADAQNEFKGKLMEDADGYYNAVSVEHQGDTRGDAWYSMITGVGVNSTMKPVSGPSINAVTPNGY